MGRGNSKDKAPEWEYAWHSQEIARKPLWLECSEPGDFGEMRLERKRPDHLL